MQPARQKFLTRRWVNPYIEKVSTLPEYIYDPGDSAPDEQLCAKIRLRMKQFVRTVLEFGSGSGGHLIARAQASPDTLFIGFEIRFKRAVRTAEKAQALGLNNLIVIRTFAEFAPAMFTPGSISGVYVLFPDPWDKRRWKKHRLMGREFLESIARVLGRDGFLLFRTDHCDYFEETKKLIESSRDWASSDITPADDFISEAPKSEFEELFQSQGATIYSLAANKS